LKDSSACGAKEKAEKIPRKKKAPAWRHEVQHFSVVGLDDEFVESAIKDETDVRVWNPLHKQRVSITRALHDAGYWICRGADRREKASVVCSAPLPLDTDPCPNCGGTKADGWTQQQARQDEFEGGNEPNSGGGPAGFGGHAIAV
jgi:hypothetical protein